MDTSAAAKLVFEEPESAALRLFLAESELVSSALLEVELLRVAQRAERAISDDVFAVAEALLATVTLTPIDAAVTARAARVGRASLRTLDAIHLASALRVADSVNGLVVYDQRLQTAAHDERLAVAAPAS
jgi:predicted nucleic acid-binding protein